MRLSSLVTNILKFNKLENQQIFPEMKIMNLSESVCECILNFEQIWEDKRIEIETDIEENIEVLADQEMLSLVWIRKQERTSLKNFIRAIPLIP